MKLLLDTHAFLWWWFDMPQLSEPARQAVASVDSTVHVSAAVAWEIVIKRALGKLEFEGDVGAALAAEGFVPLPIEVAHTDALAGLPGLHRDPFDRIQIAQAQVEGLTLVTHDAAIRAYGGVSILAT